jgi:lysophospholipase L1-like esterase
MRAQLLAIVGYVRVDFRAQGARVCRLALLALAVTAIAAAAPAHWVVSWGASPSPLRSDEVQVRKKGLAFDHQTVREIVHLSIGGSTVRVRFSNVFGKQSLEIGAAHLALRTSDSAIASSSDRPLTFGGAPSISVPPNAFVLSDPVELAVPAGSDLAISIFLRRATLGAAIHYFAQQTSYVGQGDLTAAPSIPHARAISAWAFLAGVDVSAPRTVTAVAAFGDSITDGDGSTENANQRWPNQLAKRLAQAGRPLGVLNAGIIGNRVLHDAPETIADFGVNALARFDRDVLDQPGVKFVILLEGVNDLGLAGTSLAPLSETVSVDDLIAAIKQVIERAHDRGVKIIGATLTPFNGATIPGYFDAGKEVKREALNRWIRSSHAFDGVIDFDKAVRDPARPDKIRPTFDSGDHLHPGDAGYQAMAEAIDLALFK